MNRQATIHVKHAKEALVHQIETMTMSIPQSFNSWSHNKAVDFKNAVDAAARYAKRTQVTMSALAKHSANLKRFWE